MTQLLLSLAVDVQTRPSQSHVCAMNTIVKFDASVYVLNRNTTPTQTTLIHLRNTRSNKQNRQKHKHTANQHQHTHQHQIPR